MLRLSILPLLIGYLMVVLALSFTGFIIEFPFYRTRNSCVLWQRFDTLSCWFSFVLVVLSIWFMREQCMSRHCSPFFEKRFHTDFDI